MGAPALVAKLRAYLLDVKQCSRKLLRLKKAPIKSPHVAGKGNFAEREAVRH
jgi:hypothetical protein